MSYSYEPVLVLGGIPVIIWVSLAYPSLFWNTFFEWLMGKGSRFRWYELLLVLTGITIDDMGTSIGMQAEETPRTTYEANSFMIGTWNFFKSVGLADTFTSGMRLNWIYLVSLMLAAHYFGTLNAWLRFYFILLAAFKAYAGYAWWTIKPNTFTIMDFLTFKSGRPTPERENFNTLVFYNATHGHSMETHDYRRRLAEGPESEGYLWYVKYLRVIFPSI